MAETLSHAPKIVHFEPVGKQHELANQATLDRVSMSMQDKAQMIPLYEYLGRENAKPRGFVGGETDLNSHYDTFILKEGGEIKLRDLTQLKEMLHAAGFEAELLGVQAIGNANQVVAAQVQGVDSSNPKSGYERPTVSEGPHMIIAPYAYDKDGDLHVFRTIQYRTGSAGIDTVRGFMDAETLATGSHLYKIEGASEKVQSNLQRIVKEEGGEKLLKIKSVKFLGSHVVNKSFVVSPSALFGVEVDYDAFKKLKNVISADEAKRRSEAKSHEGLTDIVLDMTPEQYVHYKTDPSISKDMAADSATDIIMMGHLLERKKGGIGNLVKRAFGKAA